MQKIAIATWAVAPHSHYSGRRRHRNSTMMMQLTLVIFLTSALLSSSVTAFQSSQPPRRITQQDDSSSRCYTATTTTLREDDILTTTVSAPPPLVTPKTKTNTAPSTTRAKAKEVVETEYVQFVQPLLEDGYPPAVTEYEAGHHIYKPLLLYIPGFDGTILAPFLQFPSLSEEFDVRAMKIDNRDRSTFLELKTMVIEYLLRECKVRRSGQDDHGPDKVYIFGESFGGILSTELAMELKKSRYQDIIDLQGLILVNPATSYLRSIVYKLAPPIATAKPSIKHIPLLEGGEYAFNLLTQLVSLFLNEDRFLQQLIRITTFRGLPSVVNNAQREAYMGRVAFAIPLRLKFMPKNTFQWRLREWMEVGASRFEDRLKTIQEQAVAATAQQQRDGNKNIKERGVDSEDIQAMLKVSKELRTTIVVGELDAMPSLEEAERLSSNLFQKSHVHIVKGAGHISTAGGSLHLVELIRETFEEINLNNRRKSDGSAVLEELHGLEPRYDNAFIGMMPWEYWSKDNYKQVTRD